MKTEPKIEEWMLDAAKECEARTRATRNEIDAIAAIIARHAPQNQPAPSIWRPVSVKPTEADRTVTGLVVILDDEGDIMRAHWSDVGTEYTRATHWTRTADLLALAPLPKVKTQAELDDEFVAACVMNSETTPDNIHRAIAYGRATAKGAAQ